MASSVRVLTPEQCMIIDYIAPDGTKVIINSFAGCAKTTTAREIVKKHGHVLKSGMSLHHNQRSTKRFLYLVFNRDAEKAAKKDFYERDKNHGLVHVRTHHSLALKFFIEMLRAKINSKHAVGRGVVRALAKIDRKIAQLRGVTHCAPTHDPALCDDELVNDELVALDDDDGPPMQHDDDDCSSMQEDDFRGGDDRGTGADQEEDEMGIFSSLVPEEDGDTGGEQSGHALPLDLESDQLKPFGLERGDPALEVLQMFCREPGNEVLAAPSARHVAFLMPERDPTLPLAPVQQQVLVRAQAAWRETINGRVNPKNGNLIISHEATLKLFCALRKDSEEFIAQQYHCILFDEAQDIDVILMEWIDKSRRFACYLIGDACQSIYNFKGALNAMDHLKRGRAIASAASSSSSSTSASLSSSTTEAPPPLPHLQTFFLSQSFRFGPSVATIANALLERSGRFAALGCNARLSSAPSIPNTKLIHVAIDADVKRQKMQRTLTRQETTSHYLAQLYKDCVEANEPLEMTVIARKNNTLLTLAIELASQNVFVRLSGKLLDKLRQGALVLAHYHTLEHIDGRVDYLERVLRCARNEKALSNMYRTMGADEDAARARGHKPWFLFVHPLAGCGEPTFSAITSRVCDQVLSELHMLQLALFMRDLYKMKTALAALLQNSDSARREEESRCILLSTVHAAKGGEWADVLTMDDFPDLCTLIHALSWCRGPKANLYRDTLFDETRDSPINIKKRVATALTQEILTNVIKTQDRDDALSYVMRTLSSAKSFADFVTSLDEELHLYYVAITRAKRRLHIGVLIQRFENAMCTQE